MSIAGAGFGPAGAPVLVAYGAAGVFQLQSAAVVNDSLVQGLMGEGCGSGLAIQVFIGAGAVAGTALGESIPCSTAASANATLLLNYSPPANALSGVYFSMSPTSNLATAGGDTVIVACSDPNYQHCYFGPATASVAVTASSSPSSASVYVPCFHAAGPLAHAQLLCTMPPGVGVDWTWTVSVCGLPSDPCSGTLAECASAQVTAYAPPSLTLVSGLSNDNTAGGEAFSIAGTNLGYQYTPGVTAGLPPIASLVYGPISSPALFNASSCAVNALGTVATCLSGPGHGAGPLIFTVVVGNQTATSSPQTGAGYGAPIISEIAGAGATLADTAGLPLGSVSVFGSNFGSSMAYVTASYTVAMATRATNTGLVPYGGIYTVFPVCILAVAHTQLACSVPPGGGAALRWSIVVDGLVNVAPSSSYGLPLVNGYSGVTAVATTGGQTLTLLGVDLGGTPGLLQAVTLGPVTATELVVTNWTWIGSDAVQIVTPPGVGSSLRVIVTVADQASGHRGLVGSLAALLTLPLRVQVGPPSAPLFSYAPPNISLISPPSAGSYSDPASPTSVQVQGVDFGLSSPAVGVVVGFGNPGDGTFVVLPITSRAPALVTGTVAQAGYVGVPQQVETITFYIPSGVGTSLGHASVSDNFVLTSLRRSRFRTQALSALCGWCRFCCCLASRLLQTSSPPPPPVLRSPMPLPRLRSSLSTQCLCPVLQRVMLSASALDPPRGPRRGC